MTNAKCNAWATAIVESLSARLGALYVVSKLYDASNDTYVKVALVAGGNQSVKAIVKIAPETPLANGAYDSLGLAQTVYCPHVASILFDLAATATTTTERFWVERAVFALGTAVKIYEKTATGTVIVVADIAPAQFVVGANNIEGSFGSNL